MTLGNKIILVGIFLTGIGLIGLIHQVRNESMAGCWQATSDPTTLGMARIGSEPGWRLIPWDVKARVGQMVHDGLAEELHEPMAYCAEIGRRGSVAILWWWRCLPGKNCD